MATVFVSYSHQQGEFVWSRLVPVLKEAGAEVVIDVERFRLGVGCYQQMDAAQDAADFQLLCFSDEYLKSKACAHEWRRAIASDPGFTSGKIIPLKLEDGVKLPQRVRLPNPLFANLHDGADAAPWRLLMESLRLKPQWCPLSWLTAAHDIATAMGRMKSVNLVVDDGVQAATLLDHLRECQLPDTLVPKLKRVSLADFRSAQLRGFLELMLEQLQIRNELPMTKLAASVEFGRLMNELSEAYLALEYFDMVAVQERRREYGYNLFAAFFDLTQKRKLSLLVISHQPYALLLPPSHPVSAIPFYTVELRRLP